MADAAEISVLVHAPPGTGQGTGSPTSARPPPGLEEQIPPTSWGSGGGGTGRLMHAAGDVPIAIQRNTFLEVDGAPPAAQRARVLRRHKSDGDPAVADDTERRHGDGDAGGEVQEFCTVCRELLVDDLFTWPGCITPHRLHARCLGGILAGLPEWPQQRPDDSDLTRIIGTSMAAASAAARRSGGNPLACPTCRNQWTDSDGIATVLRTLPEWPRRPATSDHGAQQSAPEERPRRPLLPPVYCPAGGSEMDWSTFRRIVRDGGASIMPRPGPWQGEFQCTGESCAGNHRAPPVPVDVPNLWQRSPVPRVALPRCQCQGTFEPVLLHSPTNNGEGQWCAGWLCYSCGVQTRATAEQTVDVGLWMLLAECLGTTQWEEATTATTSQAFWTAIRDKVQQVIRAPSSGSDLNTSQQARRCHSEA